MILRYQNMPSEFIDLLKSDMNTNDVGFKKLKNNYWHSGSINALIKNCFKDIDDQGRFERIIHSLGWLGFRDRLASAYIEYQISGKFPEKPQLKYIDDILQLEDTLNPYTVEGFGRGFLLGFYLKLINCHELEHSANRLEKLIPDDVINLFDVGQSKVLTIDWLCLTLFLLSKYKRVGYLKEGLSDSMNFQDFVGDLPPQEKDEMMFSLVTYGASIEDQDMFFSEVV